MVSVSSYTGNPTTEGGWFDKFMMVNTNSLYGIVEGRCRYAAIL